MIIFIFKIVYDVRTIKTLYQIKIILKDKLYIKNIFYKNINQVFYIVQFKNIFIVVNK
jgi:hypothetical protein